MNVTVSNMILILWLQVYWLLSGRSIFHQLAVTNVNYHINLLSPSQFIYCPSLYHYAVTLTCIVLNWVLINCQDITHHIKTFKNETKLIQNSSSVCFYGWIFFSLNKSRPSTGSLNFNSKKKSLKASSNVYPYWYL